MHIWDLKEAIFTEAGNPVGLSVVGEVGQKWGTVGQQGQCYRWTECVCSAAVSYSRGSQPTQYTAYIRVGKENLECSHHKELMHNKPIAVW